MDTSHLQPAVPAPHQNTDQHNNDFRTSTSARRDDQANIRTERSPGARGPVPSNMGAASRMPRKTLVLCFDGTGNEFHGDSSDSNILKIFRMLDRSSGKGFHYYQPGIGTYVASADLTVSGTISKIKNAYIKAKDAAIGTSFDDHVVGGYKFLMQYYTPGDNIYMFGFSRGSYTARFLAEMIDWVGLITHGNEEMIQFAWRTFSKWKVIDSNNKDARMKQKKAYDFMVSFRETFSRPVRRIRFLGLFDTVNSVPRFENALFSRDRIPFPAISSAKIIRHAVSIDERRAKFRADLVSHGMAARRDENLRDGIMAPEGPHHDWVHRTSRYKHKPTPKPKVKPAQVKPAEVKTAQTIPAERRESLFPEPRHDPIVAGPRRDSLFPGTAGQGEVHRGRKGVDEENHVFRYRSHSRAHSNMSHATNASEVEPRVSFGPEDHSQRDHSQHDHGHHDHNHHDHRPPTGASEVSSIVPPTDWEDDLSSDGDEDDQDIEELWFPGGHADIGGGWAVEDGETPLSHIPLVWIVREAKNSGLELDEEKMQAMDCLDDTQAEGNNNPMIEISTSTEEEKIEGSGGDQSRFKSLLVDTPIKSKIHDCLRFHSGSPAGTVIRWRLMEWMPFRRLDLTDDGKWKPIRWPLPRGEVRDMPADAKIHRSAIHRLENNPSYRPGNLICGGGGRGYITAPKEAGIGHWVIAGEEGDIVGERYIREPKVEGENSNGVKTDGH